MKILFRSKRFRVVAGIIILIVVFSIGVQTYFGLKPLTQNISVQGSVLTQHNDNARTGAYLAETQLTPSNVNPSSFGRLYSRRVDGRIVAQPLYVKGLTINGMRKNVLYVVTSENKVYAFDADNADPNLASGLLWLQQLNDSIHHEEAAPLPGMDYGPKPCGETHGDVGIMSTPVIDANTYTMYLVFRSGLPSRMETPTPYSIYDAHFYLEAIDIRNGQTRQGPVEIAFSNFNANVQLNRPGLLLLNGIIYLGFGAAVCDYGGGNPWVDTTLKPRTHGWVFAYRAQGLQLLDAFNTSPNTSNAGIWQSGSGLVGDVEGNVYAFTGNNGYSGFKGDNANYKNTNNKDDYINNGDDLWIIAHDPNHMTELGESILKLRLGPDSKFVVEHFTVENWFRLDTGERFPGDPRAYENGPSGKVHVLADSDLGSGGPILLPNGWIVGGGKQGKLYVVNPADIAHPKQSFQAFYNTWHPEIDPSDYDESQKYGPNIYGSPVIWHPADVNYALIYAMPARDYLRVFKVYANGHMDEYPAMTTMNIGIRSPDGIPGGSLSLSANGGLDGILWVSVPRQNADTTGGGVLGRLIAFDALTLRELWRDDSNVPFAKFTPPTVAGGKVFRVAYKDEIIVYGLRHSSAVDRGRPANNPISPPQPISAVWNNSKPNYLDLFMMSKDGTIIGTY